MQTFFHSDTLAYPHNPDEKKTVTVGKIYLGGDELVHAAYRIDSNSFALLTEDIRNPDDPVIHHRLFLWQ